MNKPRLKMIAGKDKITKTGLSAMLTKAKKNPAPITVPTPGPTLNRSGPSNEAAIQSPKAETDQRTPNLTRKYCISCLLYQSFPFKAAKYLAIDVPVLAPNTDCSSASLATITPRIEPNCLMSFLRVAGPTPGIL